MQRAAGGEIFVYGRSNDVCDDLGMHFECLKVISETEWRQNSDYETSQKKIVPFSKKGTISRKSPKRYESNPKKVLKKGML